MPRGPRALSHYTIRPARAISLSTAAILRRRTMPMHAFHRFSRMFIGALAFAPVLYTLAALPACDGRDTAASTAANRGEPDATYETRGIIEELPDPANRFSELRIHHEAIPEFKDHTGAVVGMNAMVMHFPVAKGVSLDGFKVGDKVRVTFVVWSKPGERGWELREIEKLDAATALHFGPAR